MKIVHPSIETAFNFENFINVLNVENGKFFREVVEDFILQIDGYSGKFVLSKDDNILQISKCVCIVTDVFNLDFSDKKLQNKLYSSLTAVCEQKFQQEYLYLQQTFYAFFQKLNAESDFALDYSEELSLSSLLKCFSVCFETQNLNFIEKLCLYIEILISLLGVKIVVFVNLKSCLSQTELSSLYQFIIYNKINVLLIENNAKNKLENEFVITIDNDLCEIVA